MIQTFTSLFKNKEIRTKIFFTLAMLFIYRLGSGIPVPGVDATALTAGIADNSILGITASVGIRLRRYTVHHRFDHHPADVDGCHSGFDGNGEIRSAGAYENG